MMEHYEDFPEQSQENLLTSQLPERYGISKSRVYERMNALHIQTFKENGRACISPSSLRLMDDLNSYLKTKQGEIKDFFQQCLDEGRIVFPKTPQLEDLETEATVTKSEAIAPQSVPVVAQQPQFPVEASKESSQSTIAQLQAQRGQQTRASDIQEVAEQAQIQAFNRIVAREKMTLIYEATEDFTVPGLREQLEEHRAANREARQSRNAAHEVNDFLAEAVALAMNGSNSSTASSRSQSPTANGVFTSA